MARRESSSLNFESETTRLLGGIFSTPLPDERIYQDKNMSPIGNASLRLDLISKMNHRLGCKSSFGDPFNPRVVPYMEPNLIDLDDPTDSKATSIDPKEVQLEIGFFNKWVTKEESKHAHLEKEREQATLEALVERDNLLRRMPNLKEQNKKLEERKPLSHLETNR